MLSDNYQDHDLPKMQHTPLTTPSKEGSLILLTHV